MEELLLGLFQAVLYTLVLLYHLLDDEGLSSDKGKGKGLEIGTVVFGRIACASPNSSGFLQRGLSISLVHGGEYPENMRSLGSRLIELFPSRSSGHSLSS